MTVTRDSEAEVSRSRRTVRKSTWLLTSWGYLRFARQRILRGKAYDLPPVTRPAAWWFLRRRDLSSLTVEEISRSLATRL